MNEAGTMVQETEYMPFGLAIPRAAGTNKYTFLGREKQPETEYMDLKRRFYDPATGRFMQVDPVTADQENYSTYQYGWNNPILRSDPNGDCPNCVTALIGAVVGGGIELGGQLLSGKSLNEVDWADVGVETLKGGLIGSGIGAAYVATAEVAGVAVKASFDYSTGEGGNKNVFNGKKSGGQALVDATVDVVAGKAAGGIGKKITGALEKGLEASVLAETKAARSLIKAENTFNKVTDGGKNMFGAKSMMAATKLGSAQSTSKAAREAVVRANMAASMSKSPVGSVVKNGVQNTVVDNLKSLFGL